MRTTKALLLAAAVGAVGIASSMAQTVYSVNVVGFVNVNLLAGNNLVCNPLKGTNDLLATIIPVLPDFSTATKWDPTNQQFLDAATYIGGWDLNPVIEPGEAIFINMSEAATITFVGEVRQGTLSTPMVSGFSFVGSQVPQAGDVTAVLGLVPDDFDSAQKWNATNQGFGDTYTYIGGWDSPLSLEIGEGLVVSKGAPGNWTRTFNVNP